MTMRTLCFWFIAHLAILELRANSAQTDIPPNLSESTTLALNESFAPSTTTSSTTLRTTASSSSSDTSQTTTSLPTTSESATSSPSTSTETTTLSSANNINFNSDSRSAAGRCLCDLTTNQCDVNCCCDRDCDQEERKLFSSCWREPASKFGQRYCSARREHLWADNSPRSSVQRMRSGLFCIVTDNMAKAHVYPEKASISDEAAFQSLRIGQLAYHWTPAAPEPGSEPWLYRSYYADGSPVFIVNQDGVLDVLSLPSSLNSAACVTRKPARFLQQESHSCSNVPAERAQLCSPAWNLTEFFTDMFVLQNPPQSPDSSKWNKTNELISIVPRWCISGDCYANQSLPDPSYDPEDKACLNTLKALTYNIIYNGTSGIRKVFADFEFADTSRESSQHPVRFQTAYNSLGTSNIRPKSGNPGYLRGKPVLVLKPGAAGEAETYDHLKVFPSSATCRDRVVQFGVNSLNLCQVEQYVINRTQWCLGKWTPFLFNVLYGDANISQWRVATFGNSLSNESSQWLPLVLSSNVACLSRTVRSEMSVVYSRSGSYDVAQMRIVGLDVRLSGDEKSLCSDSVCRFQFSNAINFVDASGKALYVLAEPPRLRLQLPADFFYPFLLSSSGTALQSFTASGYLVVHSMTFIICFIRV